MILFSFTKENQLYNSYTFYPYISLILAKLNNNLDDDIILFFVKYMFVIEMTNNRYLHILVLFVQYKEIMKQSLPE